MSCGGGGDDGGRASCFRRENKFVRVVGSYPVDGVGCRCYVLTMKDSNPSESDFEESMRWLEECFQECANANARYVVVYDVQAMISDVSRIKRAVAILNRNKPVQKRLCVVSHVVMKKSLVYLSNLVLQFYTPSGRIEFFSQIDASLLNADAEIRKFLPPPA